MKRAYNTPQLASLGSLREVTAGGSHGSSTKRGPKRDGRHKTKKKPHGHGH